MRPQQRAGVTVFYARFLSVIASFPRLLDHYQSGRVQGVRAIDVTSTPLATISSAAAQSDVVVIDQSVLNAATWPAINHVPIYHVVAARPRAWYEDVVECLLRADARRALLGNSDLHDVREDALHDRLDGYLSALFWLHEKAPPSLAQIPDAYRDPWITETDPLQRWQATVARFPVRVESWFAVAAEDFADPGAPRRWDACVPGARYRTRALARASMDSGGVSVAPFRSAASALRAVELVAQRLPASPLQTRAIVAARNRMQRSLLTRSSTAFVCGSGARYPVLKYLEVPAAGAALVTYPCVGLADFGFRDGVHAVYVAPEDAGRAAAALVNDNPARERMAAAAQEVVRAHHTVERRAADLAECMQRLAVDDLHGARFVDGRFEIW